MGYREVASDSGYMEQDDDPADDEPERPPEPDPTCEICSGSLSNCPHGRSDFDPVAEAEAEFDRLVTGRQAEPSSAMERLMRAVLGETMPEGPVGDYAGYCDFCGCETRHAEGGDCYACSVPDGEPS